MIFALFDEVNCDEEDHISNLMNDSDTEFVWHDILENEVDSDDEPLNLLVLEANYHVVENLSVERPGRFR